jgi:hypothetical protein
MLAVPLDQVLPRHRRLVLGVAVAAEVVNAGGGGTCQFFDIIIACMSDMPCHAVWSAVRLFPEEKG